MVNGNLAVTEHTQTIALKPQVISRDAIVGKVNDEDNIGFTGFDVDSEVDRDQLSLVEMREKCQRMKAAYVEMSSRRRAYSERDTAVKFTLSSNESYAYSMEKIYGSGSDAVGIDHEAKDENEYRSSKFQRNFSPHPVMSMNRKPAFATI
jgi:hypothetical protein